MRARLNRMDRITARMGRIEARILRVKDSQRTILAILAFILYILWNRSLINRKAHLRGHHAPRSATDPRR
jgi:hypothetical protein